MTFRSHPRRQPGRGIGMSKVVKADGREPRLTGGQVEQPVETVGVGRPAVGVDEHQAAVHPPRSAASRSSLWRSRWARRASTVAGSRAMLRAEALDLGVPSTTLLSTAKRVTATLSRWASRWRVTSPTTSAGPGSGRAPSGNGRNRWTKGASA